MKKTITEKIIMKKTIKKKSNKLLFDKCITKIDNLYNLLNYINIFI